MTFQKKLIIFWGDFCTDHRILQQNRMGGRFSLACTLLYRYVYKRGKKEIVSLGLRLRMLQIHSLLYFDYILQEVLHYFGQMVYTLQYVHSKLILHRDLKSQNILLNCKKTVIKLGDFGISKVLTSKSKAYTVSKPEFFSNCLLLALKTCNFICIYLWYNNSQTTFYFVSNILH